MRIALVNGSPKPSRGASGVLLDGLRERLGGEHVCIGMKAGDSPEALLDVDVLVLAFPLYVDSIPSHVLRWLESIEGLWQEAERRPRLYAMVNCGFFEARQNLIALDILRNWCEAAALPWGQAIAIGGGGMLEGRAEMLGKGPLSSIGRAVDVLAVNILLGESGDTETAQPGIPRFFYIRAAHWGWHSVGKKNGLSKKDLDRRIPAEEVLEHFQ